MIHKFFPLYATLVKYTLRLYDHSYPLLTSILRLSFGTDSEVDGFATIANIREIWKNYVLAAIEIFH